MDLRSIMLKSMGIAVVLCTSLSITVLAEKDQLDFEVQAVEYSKRDDGVTGEASEEFTDGDYYSGSYVNGKRDGMGTYSFNNGDIYTGEWKDDEISGAGKYMFADGASMIGEFDEGVFMDGVFSYSDADGTYEVTVDNGEYTDQFKATFLSGDVYEGTYDGGAFEGKCEITYASGDTYTGMVADNLKEGVGTYVWANGASYTGDWENDEMNGTGVYYYTENTFPRLEGTFVNNQPEGTLEYFIGETVSVSTEWSNGTCVG